MQVLEQDSLFTDLSTEQAAAINGGCYRYRRTYYNPCSASCYNNYSYGTNYDNYGYGYDYRYGYRSSRATVVNVYYYY